MGHQVEVHHVRPSRRFYRFIRDYDLSAEAASAVLRKRLGLSMIHTRTGPMPVGTFAVTVITTLGNSFDVQVHPHDTIAEVLSLRLPALLASDGILSWGGQDLSPSRTVEDCAFVEGATLLQHRPRAEFLAEMDADLAQRG